MPERRALGPCPLCGLVMWADDVSACNDCAIVVCGDCSATRRPLDYEIPPESGLMPVCINCYEPDPEPLWKQMLDTVRGMWRWLISSEPVIR